MEDVSEVFKNGFLGLYKSTIKKNYQQKTLNDRVNNFNNMRRECRNALISKRRQIDENKQITENDEKNKRLEVLKKWKMDKQRQKEEEKKKAKAVFKVYHVPEVIGLPNLENVNKQIKGKPIKLNTSHNHQSQFAPPNHKFKAPTSVKPIHMQQPSKSSKVKSKIDFCGSSTNFLEKDKLLSKGKGKETPVSQMCTRAMTRNLRLEPNKLSETKNSKNVNRKLEANKKNALSTNSIKPTTNVKVKQSPPKKSKTEVMVSKRNINSGSVANVPLVDNNKNANVRNSSKRKGKQLNFEASETKASPIENSDSVKLSQKRVGWNRVETVGEDSFSHSAIKTPKGATKQYNKTPRKPKVNTSNTELSDESNNKDLMEDNLSVTPNIKESNNELKTIELEHSNSQNQSAVSTKKNDSFHTPLKTNMREASPVYISPFVTVSRGKNSARKEYKIRRSVGDSSPDISDDILKSTSPKAGAAYFLKKLNNEINRIEGICKTWNDYKASNELPEEATDMINVAIGQSNLLISKKFQQFRNLIEECRNCEYIEKPVTCEDLHGFWDMVYMQVGDLDKRFNNLNVLKANNWQEIVPEKKTVAKRGRGRPKKASANPALKNLIKAARDAKKSTTVGEARLEIPQIEETKVSSGDHPVKSPVNPNRGRRSLRVSLLSSQTKSRASSSPGLTMMKISQAIKCGEGMTPGKSILKSDLTRSAKKITKSVLFKDNLEEDVVSEVICASEKLSDTNDGDRGVNKENDVNEINLITFSPATPSRRSKRLSKMN